MDRVVLRPGCVVDLGRRSALVGLQQIPLTAREVDLLRFLAARVGETVSVDELHREVWGHSKGTLSRAAFQTIRRLRTKLEPDPGRPRHLITAYGTGFRLLTEASAPAVTPLFGRDGDLSGLREALGRERLVTVTGLGGVGKTALFRALQRESAGLVVWVDLGPCTSEVEVVAAAGAALELEDRSELRVAMALAALGPVLVLLDEAEGATDPLRRLLARWLDRAPEARFGCTSRVPLRAYGECVLALDPLPVPAPTDPPAQVEANPSMQVWRAMARGPVGPDVVALVRATEGYPLAIALAAARRDPAVPAPDAPDPVERAIAWAWSALSPDGQAVLAACSVFAGAVTVEAVEAISGGWAVDALEELVDASLVVRRAARFQLLERTRRFAGARLSDREATEARHEAWFARFAGVRGGVPAEWLDDARIACTRALARGDGAVAAACAVAAARRVERTGPIPLAADLLQAVVEVTADERAEIWLGWMEHRSADAAGLERLERVAARATDPAIRGSALHRIGEILVLTGRGGDPAGRALEEALTALRACGDTEGQVDVLGLLGAVALAQGRPEVGLTRCREGLRQVVDRGAEGHLLTTLGRLHAHRGDAERGIRVLANAVSAFRDAGDLAAEGDAQGHVSRQYRDLGRYRQAREHAEAALAIQRSVGSPRGWASALLHLGVLDQLEGRLDDAIPRLREAFAIFSDAGDFMGVANVLAAEASVLCDQGRLDEAVVRLEEGIALRRRARSPYGVAAAEMVLVRVLTDLGRTEEALELSARARAGLREAGAARSELLVDITIADLHRRRGELAEARAYVASVLDGARDLGDTRLTLLAHGTLARVELAEGRWDEAIARLEGLLPELRASVDRPNTMLVLALLADAWRGRGQLDTARERLAEAEGVAPLVPFPSERAHLAYIRARIALAAGDRAAAAEALDEARQLAPPAGSEVAGLLAALEAELDA